MLASTAQGQNAPRRRVVRWTAVLLLSLALMAAGSSVWSQRSLFMGFGPRGTPPIGFLKFCLHEPAECELDGSELRKPAAQAALWRRYYWTVIFAETPPRIEPSLEHARVVKLSPMVLAKLEGVNQTVNHQISYVADALDSVALDDWHLPRHCQTKRG